MDADSTSDGFTLDLKAHRIEWGWRNGRALGDALDHANIRRYLLIASARSVARFHALASAHSDTRRAAVFTGIAPHVPVATADAASETARRCDADGVIAFGGGSALDTAKAVAHRTGLPIVAIPTNFSGSEVTWNYGLTVDGAKQTHRNPDVLPRAVIYDAALIGTLPMADAICSGVNAIAHAVEALYACEANPYTQSIAEAGIASMIDGLRRWTRDGFSGSAGKACLRGAWLCGEALSQVGMGLHHRVCHVLGGTFSMPHAATHTALLPYVIDFNRDQAPALAKLDALFDGEPFARALAAFATAHGASATLADLGLRHDALTRVSALALATPVANPRVVSVADLDALLQRAWRGELAPSRPISSAIAATSTERP